MNLQPESSLNRYRVRFVQMSTLMMGPTVIASTLLRWYFSDFPMQNLYMPLAMGFMLLLVAYDSRKNHYRSIHGFAVLTSVLLIVINAGLVNGGLRAPVAAAIFLVPFISFILFGSKGHRIGFVMMIAVIALMTIFDLLDINKAFDPKHSRIFYPIIYTSLAIVVWSILSAFTKAKEELDELRLKMVQKEISSSNVKSMFGLVHGLSHEINNPLAIISSNLQAFDPSEDSEKSKVRIDKMLRATTRISNLIHQLNKFSESFDHKQFGVISLKTIIEESMGLAMATTKFPQTNVSIECSEHFEISCSPNEIRQVFYKLFDNAFYGAQDFGAPWIKVVASQVNAGFRVLVEDSGPGIPKEIQDRIFNPFFTTKDPGEGTGLGLPLAKAVLEKHGATLKIIEGTGHTCFEVWFPIKSIE